MLGRRVCRIEDVPDRQAKGFPIEGAEHDIFIYREGMSLRAYVNSCPHLGTPLNFLEHRFMTPDRARIQCATHGAQFEPATGLCVQGPCLGAHLKPVPVEIDGETVRVAYTHS